MFSNFPQEPNHEIPEECLTPQFIPSEISSTASILPKFKKFSTYLASLNSFQSESHKQILTHHFITISLHDFFQLTDSTSPELSSTLLCSFVDIMRLYAPDIPYESATLNFYLNYLINWFLSYNPKNSSSSSLEIKFEYIINRLGKSNILSLVVETQFENKIPLIISKVLEIQKEKKFLPTSDIFTNLNLIITGLLEEMNDIPSEIFFEILGSLNRKKDINKYLLCRAVLVKMKNFLASTINDLITSDKMPLKGKEYCIMIKELGKIHFEFLVKFFLNVPDKKLNEKINDVKYIYILLKLFACEGSLEIAMNYKHFITAIFDRMTNKKTSHELKVKIVKSFIKFITRNKIRKEDEKLYLIIVEKIRVYLRDIKTEGQAQQILNILKKIPKWKIIKMILTSLIQSTYSVVSISATIFAFELYNDKIFKAFNLFYLNSIDKIKLLNKASELFKVLFNELNEDSCLIDVIHSEFNKYLIPDKEESSLSNIINFLIIIFSVISEHKAHMQLHKYIMLFYFSKDNIIQNKDKVKDDNSEITLTLFNDYSSLNSLTEFFCQYINNVDEESNKNSIFILNSILYIMVYYIKYLIYQFNFSPSILNTHLNTIIAINDSINILITHKIHNKDTISTIMILLRQLINVNISNASKERIRDLIVKDLSNFILTNNDISPKGFAYIFYDQSDSAEGTINNLLPEGFIDKFRDFTLDNPIKFTNEILKIDKEGRFTNVLFNEEIMKVILLELKEYNKENTIKTQEILKIDEEDNDAKKKMMRLLSIYHEILKYQFYHLIKIKKFQPTFTEEANKLMKFILNMIYDYFNNSYISDSKEKSKTKSKKKKTKSKSTINIETQIQLLCTAKYINLILKFCENEIQIKPSHQIKIMNLLLCREIFIRNHFIQKIYKKITNQNSSLLYYMNIIPMLTIAFRDHDQSLAKMCQGIIASFIKIISQKLKKKSSPTDNSSYKYIPEIYLSYIFVYFIFNSNLNVMYQRDIKKTYFTEIISTFLKTIKKQCNNKLDSDFLLRLITKIKNENLKDKKVIKKIFNKGVYLDIGDFDSDDVDYETVKNGICELAKRIISANFMVDFTYGKVKPRIPVIFSNKAESESIINENLNGTSKTFILDTTKIMMTASAIKSKKKLNQQNSGSAVRNKESAYKEIDKMENETIDNINN